MTASSKTLARRITVLLSHAWQPDDDELQAVVLTDWVRALRDLPFEAVDEACVRWLMHPDNIDARGRLIRPSVPAIRALALQERDLLYARSRRFLPAPPQPAPTTWDGLRLRLLNDRWNPTPGCGNAIEQRNAIRLQVAAEVRDLRDTAPEATPPGAYHHLTTLHAQASAPAQGSA